MVDLSGNSWVKNNILDNIPESVSVVKLSSCRNITDAGWLNLARWVSLERLEVAGCATFMDEQTKLLCNLVHLDLSETSVRIPSLPSSIKYLNLSFTNILPSTILPEGLVRLNVSSTALFELPPLPKLTHLDVESTNWSTRGLNLLATGSKNLSHLVVSCNGAITAYSLIQLIKQTRLEHLECDNCPLITELFVNELLASINHINLRVLTLYDSHISKSRIFDLCEAGINVRCYWTTVVEGQRDLRKTRICNILWICLRGKFQCIWLMLEKYFLI